MKIGGARPNIGTAAARATALAAALLISSTNAFTDPDSIDLATTICRDTFFADWEPIFAEAALWIDLKANGDIFDAEERGRFERAVPARIASTGVPTGATVCLTGTLLEFFREGLSAIYVFDESNGFRVLESAATFDGPAIPNVP